MKYLTKSKLLSLVDGIARLKEIAGQKGLELLEARKAKAENELALVSAVDAPGDARTVGAGVAATASGSMVLDMRLQSARKAVSAAWKEAVDACGVLRASACDALKGFMLAFLCIRRDRFEAFHRGFNWDPTFRITETDLDGSLDYSVRRFATNQGEQVLTALDAFIRVAVDPILFRSLFQAIESIEKVSSQFAPGAARTDTPEAAGTCVLTTLEKVRAALAILPDEDRLEELAAPRA
jgi:hypothetical protein